MNAVRNTRAGTFFKEPQGALQVSKRANKVGGSFQASGVIVAAFKTTEGAERFVFEFDVPKGMLHLYGASQLEAA
jgi:hypothetical protein